MKAVVHLPLNVNEGEGIDLSDKYQVGFTYPVFILANSKGEVINRWVGYTGGATVLIRTLENAMKDLTSIDERVARFEANPTYNDASYLAGFYSKSGDHLESIKYYHRALALGKGKKYDYAFEIFSNTANAVWKEMLPFDSIFPAADAMLASKTASSANIVKTAQLMTRLAKKFNRYSDAARYLRAGMKTALGPDNNISDPTYRLLLADYTVFIENDTAAAVNIKKAVMGPGWENDRDKFYEYAKWCLEREINLDEAETYARKAIGMVYPGKYRARVLGTVADICYARGNTAEAVKAVNLAIDEDPDNIVYQNQLERFQENP